MIPHSYGSLLKVFFLMVITLGILAGATIFVLVGRFIVGLFQNI